jgi:hypothetical protein
MNDKRNGAATFKRWDKQEEAIRSQKKEIEKTKNAIEREESKIKHCEAVNKEIPEPILKLVGSGQLSQWRKFPNRFFVAGVENARIIWDIKKQKLLCSYIAKIPNNDQYAKFRDIFNNLKKELTNLN